MIAALPMYDWPEIRAATDRLWGALAAALRDKGIAAPSALNRTLDMTTIWPHPDLLFAQTCGYPMMTGLCGEAQLVATPGYRVPGCDGPFYSSWLIARRSGPVARPADAIGRPVAVNSRHSQSGYAALRAVMADYYRGEALFSKVVVTGGHRQSLAAVAAGEADLCAVDAVCWALAQRHDGDRSAGLQIVGQSPSVPGLPFITGAAQNAATVAAMRDALAAVLAGPDLAETRDALFLDHVQVLPRAAYKSILEMENAAISAGYKEVH